MPSYNISGFVTLDTVKREIIDGIHEMIRMAEDSNFDSAKEPPEFRPLRDKVQSAVFNIVGAKFTGLLSDQEVTKILSDMMLVLPPHGHLVMLSMLMHVTFALGHMEGKGIDMAADLTGRMMEQVRKDQEQKGPVPEA